MPNIVGYARVSTREQNPAAQEAELIATGAVRVFVDHASRAASAIARSGSPAWNI
ncbi:DNA invertase Pin-like site-specific DNA recombinase [Leifsonia sp. 563]|uniref:recombinase family protein n=1 Tax=Leifsonia sp. 563 TaxID=3156412 RepID=UPI003398990B